MKNIKDNFTTIILFIITIAIIWAAMQLLPDNTAEYSDNVCRINGYQSDCHTPLK